MCELVCASQMLSLCSVFLGSSFHSTGIKSEHIHVGKGANSRRWSEERCEEVRGGSSLLGANTGQIDNTVLRLVYGFDLFEIFP